MTTHLAELRRLRRNAAFTLIELMVSIALVLILVLGINQVFRIASQGVGAGQAFSTVTRDIRGTPAVLTEDLRHVRLPARTPSSGGELGPAFVIRSERRYAYRNRQDHLGDSDGAQLDNPTDVQIRNRDLDGNGVQTDVGEDTPPAIYDDRSHRQDTLTFFVSGEIYNRQTGGTFAGTSGSDVFIADQNSLEAMITYGHLALPDFTTTAAVPENFRYREPGPFPQDRSVPVDTNQQYYARNNNNFYASDWALGRTIFLLTSGVDTNNDFVADIVNDRTGTIPQRFYARTAPVDAANANNFDPFAGDVNSTNKGVATNNATKTADGWPLAAARYDVLGVSMAQARDIFTNYALSGGPWWNQLTNFRYHASPIVTKPIDGASVAKTAPIFLRGCTQFIVEYTGDFVTQNNDPRDTPAITTPDLDTSNGRFGDVLAVQPPVGSPPGTLPIKGDGVPDFIVVTDANGVSHKETRWYGLPRDTNGDRVILGWFNNRRNNEMPDVVPLRDVIRTAIDTTGGFDPVAVASNGMAFERFAPAFPASGNYVVDMPLGAVYIAAWGPGTAGVPGPSMLRLTIALDEPSGAMAAEQTYEQVIALP